jgi:carboxymethylenebutenolidase
MMSLITLFRAQTLDPSWRFFMTEQIIKLTAEDGHVFEAFRVSPNNPRGGLVLLQEIFGMTEQLKSLARVWASAGYDTILPAMYDRLNPGCVLPFNQTEEAMSMMQRLENDQVLLDVRAAVAEVESGKGVSLMGFCWGGGTAARLANEIDLKGIISYYGTRLADNTANGAQCATLFHFGETDTHSPPELIHTVKQNIPEAQTHIYQAGHAFANDARPEYFDKDATLRAGKRSLNFLNQVHGYLE